MHSRMHQLPMHDCPRRQAGNGLSIICSCRCCAGTFGTVYRGTLDEVDKVAVKLMQPGLDMEKLRDTFVNEVSLVLYFQQQRGAQ